MFNLRASAIAIRSLRGSITKIALGNSFISRIPPKNLFKRSISLRNVITSFLGNTSNVPSCSIVSNSSKRAIRAWIVLKFVKVPPNQRWLTQNCPPRIASSLTAS